MSDRKIRIAELELKKIKDELGNVKKSDFIDEQDRKTK